MNRIGILQGRLLPKDKTKLQLFPSETWVQEFEVAKECGFDCMELLFSPDGWCDNPLLSKEGRTKINELSETTGIDTPSICADYFLRWNISHHSSILKSLINANYTIGYKTLLLPLLINDRQNINSILEKYHPLLEKYGVTIGLEINLPASELVVLMEEINHPNIGIYYDLGNSVSLEYNDAEGIRRLSKWICGIHVKDKNMAGKSTILGLGLVNFESCFKVLKEINYQGDYILETYMGNNPINLAKHNLEYVKELLT